MSIRTVTNFWSRYKQIAKIGQGAFGIVFLVQDNKTKRFYAIKLIPDKIEGRDREYLIYDYIQECQRGIDIDHPGQDYILLTYGRFILQEESQSFMAVLMCYARGMTLDKCNFILSEPVAEPIDYNNLPVDSLKTVALQLFQAIDYLHSLKIAHRDIKPPNIIWNAEAEQLKLIDLGNCCINRPPTKYNIYSCDGEIGLTRFFACPDVLRLYLHESDAAPFNLFVQGDIWSACLTIITLMHPHPIPDHWYKDLKLRLQAMKEEAKGGKEAGKEGEKFDCYTPLTPYLQNLAKKVNTLGRVMLLGFGRNGSRPSAGEMIKHIRKYCF